MPLILLLRKHLPGRPAYGGSNWSSQLLSRFMDLLISLQAGQCPDWHGLLEPFIRVLESSEVGGILVEACLSGLLRIMWHGGEGQPPPALLSRLLLSVTKCRFEASDFDRDELALSRLIDTIRWLVCEQTALVPRYDDEAVGRCLFTLFALLKQPRFSRVLRGHAELVTLEVARTLFTISPVEDDSLADVDDLPARPVKPALTIPYPAGRSEETVVAAQLQDQSQNRQDQGDGEEEEPLEEMPRYRLSSHSQAALVRYLLALIDPTDPRTDEQSATVALHCLRHAQGSDAGLLGPLMTALSAEGGRMSLPVGYCLAALLRPEGRAATATTTTTTSMKTVRLCDQALTRLLGLLEKCEQGSLQNPKQRTQLELLLPLLGGLLAGGRLLPLWLRAECSLEGQTMNLSRLASFLARLDPASATGMMLVLVRSLLLAMLQEMGAELLKNQLGQQSTPIKATLEARRLKERLVEAAILFGEKPKQALALLHQQGLLSDPANVVQVAALLHRMHGLLDRRSLGEYLAKPGNEILLRTFLSRFQLRGLRLDQALRLCMHSFRLPGEAQQISRVMEQLASVYFEQQQGESGGQIRDADSAYILAYSIVMLNTDQHNRQVSSKISLTFKGAPSNERG